jgi:hypothetical protein
MMRSVAKACVCKNALFCRRLYPRIIRLLFFCALGFLSSAHAQTPTYVQGLPTVGDSSSTVAAASQMSIDATQFGGSDMCAKIAAACAKTGATMPDYPKGATIDARGFTGDRLCAAANITTMLNSCVTGTGGHNGGS